MRSHRLGSIAGALLALCICATELPSASAGTQHRSGGASSLWPRSTRVIESIGHYLLSVDPATGKHVVLYHSPSKITDISTSADGRHVTFTSAGHVWARRSKNHAKVHRIYGGHGSFGKPVFQEIRGDHLYVITNNTNSIVRMDLDGAHQEVIGRLPRGWHTFDISPSGKKLIYDAYGKNVNLKAPRIESLRTGRKGKPLSLSNVDGFDWNPNGKKIEYFLQGPTRYGVGLMNGNGTHAHLVVRGAQLGTSPTLPQVVGLEWALGGRRLLAAVEDEQHDGLYLGWINPFAAHPHVTSVPGQVLHFRGAPLYDMDWARVGH